VEQLDLNYIGNRDKFLLRKMYTFSM